MTPEREEVCAWTMKIEAAPKATVANWRSCLDRDELAHADRFRFDEDRTAYVAAHWLMRNALAIVGGLPPACWRFVKGRYGKPKVDPRLDRPELQFNLSHSQGLVACVAAVGTAVGIDVETTSRQVGLEIVERYFSPAEVAILHATPRSQQRQTFFRLWTLKEALIKATGEGLWRPIDSFSFSLDPITVAFRPDDPFETNRWAFFERRPTMNHALAIAIRQPPSPSMRLSIFEVVTSKTGECASFAGCAL